jgi:hypothetical protein
MFISILIINSCHYTYSQKKDFVYKKNPYLHSNVNKSARKTDENKIFKNAIDLTKYLPANFAKDASIDYTAYIQKGLDENRIVIMPNFPLLVNENGLTMKSGSKIQFQKYSSLTMMPNSLTHYGIIKIFNIDDVIIYSPVLIGERNEHIGNKGEWGMGIYIQNAKNIQIFDPKISDCWGDGIDIGKGDNRSGNIKITNAVIDNCRRNGISIGDGYDIRIENPIISNINGTMPMCGIDIEPNDNTAILENIHIVNPITFNNSTAGILIYLASFIGPLKKNVGIRIENHLDNSSNKGFELGGNKEQNNTNQSLSGSIDIINPKWTNNRTSIYVGNNKMGPKINFKNIKIENPKENLQKIKQELSKIENVNVK